VLIPPKYILTPKISTLLSSIEASREVINSVTIPPEIETNIRRRSTLKSSLFSARIEGSDLTLDDLPKISSKSQKQKEVFNILKALNWVYSRSTKDLTTKDILKLHEMVLTVIAEKRDLGRFRTEIGAIFNSAGIAIYLPPRPSKIFPF
jgi:Fic family protein